MLNGIDPILIFTFYKNVKDVKLASGQTTPGLIDKLALPPIPIYLSEKLTGIYIESEDKSIDIETTVDGALNSEVTLFAQKPINTTVKISMKATKDSIGLNILSAMADIILPKATAKNYDVTYLNGATTVFGGLIHSFSVNQEANTTLMTVNLEILKVPKKAEIEVTRKAGTTALGNTGSTPTAIPSGGGGSSTPVPVPPSSSPMPLRPAG